MAAAIHYVPALQPEIIIGEKKNIPTNTLTVHVMRRFFSRIFYILVKKGVLSVWPSYTFTAHK